MNNITIILLSVFIFVATITAMLLIYSLISEQLNANRISNKNPLKKPCPWCGGNMIYYKVGLYHIVICEDDNCGFVSKKPTLSALVDDILDKESLRRGKDER